MGYKKVMTDPQLNDAIMADPQLNDAILELRNRKANGIVIANAKELPVRRKTPMEIGKLERAARRAIKATAAADHE